MPSRSAGKTSSSQPGTGSSARPAPGLAVSVRTDDERLYVRLDDGREVSAPLTERLLAASPGQRAGWTIEADGTAIRWEEIDEDIGVNYAIGITEDEVYDYAGYDRYSDAPAAPPARGTKRGL